MKLETFLIHSFVALLTIGFIEIVSECFKKPQNG